MRELCETVQSVSPRALHCVANVANVLRQRKYVQFKSSTSSVPRKFGKIRSCIGEILISASYRLTVIVPPFCAIHWLLSVRFRFNFKYQLAFFGSLILGLWFVRSFQISTSPRKVRSV